MGDQHTIDIIATDPFDLLAGIKVRTELEQTPELLTEMLGMVEELGPAIKLLKAELETQLLNATDHLGDEHQRREIESDGWVASMKPRPGGSVMDWELGLAAVLSRISDARLVDPETGELLERFEEAAARILPTCVPMTGSVRPKVGGFKTLGIDPSRYQKTKDWKMTVRMERKQ